MFEQIKEALNTTKLISLGEGGGGCINEGEVYDTDNGKVFIKRNSKEKVCFYLTLVVLLSKLILFLVSFPTFYENFIKNYQFFCTMF